MDPKQDTAASVTIAMGDNPPLRARFFFGHQSVGSNLLAGVQDLARDRAIPTVQELLQPTEHVAASAVLLHARLGRNTEPQSKLSELAQWLDAGLARSVDYAMLKFCYVDIASMEQARSLHAAYIDGMAGIRESHPKLRLAHCSVPLRVLPSGPYALARRILGHRHAEIERNRAREWYNDRLRQDANGAPLFDIALIQSTRPDGERCTQRDGQDRVAYLASGYSHDGGHLNDQGRRIVAVAFLDFLTALESP